MKYLILALTLLTASCTADLPTTPVSTNVVCPTGCVLPPNCHAVPAPANHPVGYEVICT